MNSEEQKLWQNQLVILVVPRNDRYEYRRYRYEQTKPATHIAHASNDERTLCGRDADDNWYAYECSAEDFDVQTFVPKYHNIKESDRLCSKCSSKFQQEITA